MANSEERTELLARASKAIIPERGASNGFGPRTKTKDFIIKPDANLNRVLEIVQGDPVVRGAITTKVDKVLESGYSFYGKDKKSRQDSAIADMEELRFDALMREMLQHLFSYSNAFIEIVKDGNKAKELHSLDPRFTEPMTDEHGDVKQYMQNVSGIPVFWTPEEVAHIKLTPLANSVWGDVDLKALWMTCAIKYHIKKLYLFQYETNDFRPLLNIKEATDDQIKRFLTHLLEARRDSKALVPIEGEVEAIVLGQMQDYTKVKELLTYLDYEILNLLQVPPIAVGSPDDSNRSSSDAQERAFNTHIRSVQRNIEDVVSNDLLPKMGYEKVTLKFNYVDDKAMQLYLENAERMKNMGIKKEIIREFLEAHGFDFPEGDIFEEQPIGPDGLPMPAGSDPAAAKKSMDMFPSRKGKAPGMANKKIGTGDAGTTRPDQLVSRAIPSWQKYEYIEVEQ